MQQASLTRFGSVPLNARRLRSVLSRSERFPTRFSRCARARPRKIATLRFASAVQIGTARIGPNLNEGPANFWRIQFNTSSPFSGAPLQCNRPPMLPSGQLTALRPWFDCARAFTDWDHQPAHRTRSELISSRQVRAPSLADEAPAPVLTGVSSRSELIKVET
jgi:hypothetical protein